MNFRPFPSRQGRLTCRVHRPPLTMTEVNPQMKTQHERALDTRRPELFPGQDDRDVLLSREEVAAYLEVQPADFGSCGRETAMGRGWSAWAARFATGWRTYAASSRPAPPAPSRRDAPWPKTPDRPAWDRAAADAIDEIGTAEHSATIANGQGARKSLPRLRSAVHASSLPCPDGTPGARRCSASAAPPA